MMNKLFCSLCQEPFNKPEEVEIIIDDDESESGERFYYCKPCAQDFFELLEIEMKTQHKIHLRHPR